MSNDREQAFRKALELNIPPTATHVMNINWLAVSGGFNDALHAQPRAGSVSKAHDICWAKSSVRGLLNDITGKSE